MHTTPGVTIRHMENLDIPELSALLKEQTDRLGPEHVDTLATRHLLARRIAENSGSAQAIPLYEQLVIDRSRVLGERHRDTLTSRHNLALCLAWCDQIESARTMFEDVIRLLEETYGKDDDDVIRTRRWYIHHVLSKLEPPENVAKEYKTLLATISHYNRKLRMRNRDIREQFEEFQEEHEELLGGSKVSEGVDDNSGGTGQDRPGARAHEPKLETFLAKLVFNELGGELVVWQRAIANDAREISKTVIGKVTSEIEDFLQTRFDSATDDDSSSIRFEVLQKLVGLNLLSARRTASQLALAYVDFAFFSIHVAQTDSESSRLQIDELRIQLRQILGSGIDIRSNEEHQLEQNFKDMVGLDTVKKQLLGFIRVLLENKRLSSRGEDVAFPRLHLVLVGNPGTGKTVVARHYSRLLFDLGLVPADKCTEIDKSHLVGPYSGDAETRAREVLDAASPGVLFIDEAYTLNDPWSNIKGSGQRALEIIMKAMEDRRETLVVILAGYKKEMDDLMTVNPGLPSRIGATIEFPNYSLDELMEIARRSASKQKISLDAGAMETLNQILGGLLPKPDFGNAREVESLIEEAKRNQLNRLAPLDDMATSEERRTILQEDIPKRQQPKSKRVGFL